MTAGTEALVPFLDALASPAPTPGGGATSAVAGALGCAQAQMVAALTVGNERYTAVRTEMEGAIERLEDLRRAFIELAEADERGYERVARALRLPRSRDDERARRASELAAALEGACEAPLAMLVRAGEAASVLEVLAAKGSSLAKSDVICAAALLRAAAEGAEATVLANTSWMADRERARAIEVRSDHERGLVRRACDEVAASVERELVR